MHSFVQKDNLQRFFIFFVPLRIFQKLRKIEKMRKMMVPKNEGKDGKSS
jgi:hypothetical protein